MSLQVKDVRFEHRDGFGIGVDRPRLSWRTETDTPGWTQVAYEVEGAGVEGAGVEGAGVEGAGVEGWGVVHSDESVLVPWGGSALQSRQRASVRVRVTGNDGEVSDWSAPAEVEAGLLETADWTAQFITPDWDEDGSVTQPCPYLRKEFSTPGEVRSARLYVSALGLFEIEINGVPVGDHVMSPGWTAYQARVRYETFDVTDLIRNGANAVGGTLAEGWYRGLFGFGGGSRNIYGERLALLAQLELTYADGSTQTIVTDDTWRASRGPLLSAEIYNGEKYDARLELTGWSEPGYDDTGSDGTASDGTGSDGTGSDGAAWAGVVVHDQDLGVLHATPGPPVRRTQIVEPVEITTSPSGKTIIDFGQNLVGRLRIRVEGPAGTTITLRHAEVLDAGELCTILLRKAECTDRYTLRGGGPETWEPRFTFHGFRYAEVTRSPEEIQPEEIQPGEIRPADVVAVVCHSDMQRTGWFECSDPRINRLHENIVWGMRGNFLDVPTDCPQRDERLGWTGDLCVFSPTATFLYNCAGFLTSWLGDLAADQHEDGMVPVVIPDVVQRQGPGPLPSQPAWGDAAIIVPWVVYQRFGDVQILRAQWASMRAWVDHVLAIAGDAHLWNKGFMFADWLDPSAPAAHPADARTDPHLVATAYLARTTEIMAETARLLGDEDEAARYRREHDAVVEAFNGEFVSPTGRVVSDSQTGYALALQFSLIRDPGQRARAAKRLQALVRHAEFRIATGFVGTPLICDALCDAGEEVTAFALLTQEACPSWLYPVSCGATTVWERWDGMLPDGSVNLASMNSFNHYALGAVGDWLHRTVGGLAPAAPGYRRMTIRPIIGGELTHASSRHLTPYGPAESSWRVDGELVAVDVEVPPNTTAAVILPDRERFEVGSGRHHWEFKRN